MSEPRREIIVRIGGHVRLARLMGTTAADAIWSGLPVYGTAEKPAAGLVAFLVHIALSGDDSVRMRAETEPLDDGILGYCLTTQRIVLGDAGPPPLDARILQAPQVIIPWARLIDPYPAEMLASVPQGARTALLHADS